jgi:hypothetical protein
MVKNDACIICGLTNAACYRPLGEIPELPQFAKSAKSEKQKTIRLQQENACIRTLFVL